MKDEYMTVSETAEMLKCGQWLIRKAIRLKELTAYKIANRVVIHTDDAQAWWDDRHKPKKI